jgi:uncharacterized membrane protein YfcA
LTAVNILFASIEQASAGAASGQSAMPWWAWPGILFGVTFAIGIIAVLGGIGGGVIFVPLMSGFFSFHLDFVRSAGLLVAVASSLSAGPVLLKKGLADLRLAMPMALLASIGAIFGAILGLALPTNIVEILLGVTILAITAIMLKTKRLEYPEVKAPDAISALMGIRGVYHEQSTGEDINWQAHRTPQALLMFVIIGVLAGMFGIGAGWANVPVLNLIMGVPLKMAVSTSNFLLSITGTSAAWIYINRGAVLPILVVPSVIGMMLGARIGAILLPRIKISSIRYIVIGLMLFAGARALLKGLGF